MDTVRDYLKKPSNKMLKILDEIGEPAPEKLKVLLELFDKYGEEAQKHLGRYRPGNVILDAPCEEYVPSEEEFLVLELGKKIEHVIKRAPKKTLKE